MLAGASFFSKRACPDLMGGNKGDFYSTAGSLLTITMNLPHISYASLKKAEVYIFVN